MATYRDGCSYLMLVHTQIGMQIHCGGLAYRDEDSGLSGEGAGGLPGVKIFEVVTPLSSMG